MLTSKQRAYLRGIASTVPALFQIGKNGINDPFIQQIKDALEAREIIKVHVLENATIDVREACHEVAALTDSEPVQVIGRKFVLYKESKNNKRIELP